MCNLTIGEMNSHPYSALLLPTAENARLTATPENTHSAHEAHQIKSLDNEETPDNIKTAWDDYLELKECVLNIKLPTSALKQHTLSDMIRQSQRKINTLDEGALKKLFDNKNNIKFFQGSPEITNQCIREVKKVIADITKTVDAIKAQTDKKNSDIRHRTLTMCYIAAGIALIGVAICLSVFLLPHAFPAVFIMSAKTTIFLDWASKIIGPLLSATGAILGWRNNVKNIKTEIDNDSWRKINETFLDLHVCLQEVGSMNVEIFVDGLNQLKADIFADGLNQLKADVFADGLNQLKADILADGLSQIKTHNSEITNEITKRLERLSNKIDRIDKQISSVVQGNNYLPSTSNTAGDSHQREASPPAVPQRRETPQHAERTVDSLIPPWQSYHSRER